MKNMNIFDEVDNIKLRAEKEILSNQNLLKLLSIGKDNPLREPDIEKVSGLVDKFVYFKPKIYETIQGTQSFLLTDVIITSIKGKDNYADIKLIFRIIVHNALFELHDGKTRSYQVAKELTSSFNNEYGTWMGKCRLDNCHPLEVPSDYQGIQLVFTMTDFK